MSRTEPVSVGILAEPFLYGWQVRAIERLRAELDVDVPLVVKNAATAEYEAESWNARNRVGLDDIALFAETVREHRAWALVLAERTVGRLLGDEEPHTHRHSLENVDCLAEADHVPCEPRTEDGWIEFPDDVVRRVADTCDVAVLFGFGLIRGDVLEAPEYGVLNLHPADIRRYRGLGPEPIFYDDRGAAGSTLQRLNETVDGGEIVAYDEVDIRDCDTLWDVWDRIFSMQIDLLAEGIAELRDPAFEPTTVTDEQMGEFYYRKRRHDLEFSGRIAAKNLVGRLRRWRRTEASPGDSEEHTPP